KASIFSRDCFKVGDYSCAALDEQEEAERQFHPNEKKNVVVRKGNVARKCNQVQQVALFKDVVREKNRQKGRKEARIGFRVVCYLEENGIQVKIFLNVGAKRCRV